MLCVQVYAQRNQAYPEPCAAQLVSPYRHNLHFIIK
jgi:hypothetical protein